LPLPPASPKPQSPLPPLTTKAAATAAIATAAIIAATTLLPHHCQRPCHHQRHNSITVSVVPFLADCDMYDLAPGVIVIVLLLLFWTLRVQAADIIIIGRRVTRQVVQCFIIVAWWHDSASIKESNVKLRVIIKKTSFPVIMRRRGVLRTH
jgi:hypothetical protein